MFPGTRLAHHFRSLQDAFVKFIVTETFPGGRLPSIDMVQNHSAAAAEAIKLLFRSGHIDVNQFTGEK
jgi:cyclopropane fatty-acyl-phospholipid synthase-like methyltransferase